MVSFQKAKGVVIRVLIYGLMILILSGCSFSQNNEWLKSEIEEIKEQNEELNRTLRDIQTQNEQLKEQSNQVLKYVSETNTNQTIMSKFKPYQTNIDKQILGRLEKIYLNPPKHYFKARIDTGATTSSLNAFNIEYFERDGNKWVRFETIDKDKKNIMIEKELVRFAKIIQSNMKEAEKRPVINLEVIIGENRQQAEFTLSNRTHLNYSVLIGRNIIQDSFIVDVSKKYLLKPTDSK